MQHAWEDFQALEKKGGIIPALQSGTLQKRIQREHQKRKSWISSGKLPIVGTTHFPQVEDTPELIQPDLEREAKRVQEYIWSRGEGPTIGGSGVGSYLSQLQSGATRFEIDKGLFFRREITTTPLLSYPDALPFEELRAKPEKMVPLLLLGEERQWTARAQFAQQLLLVVLPLSGFRFQTTHLLQKSVLSFFVSRFRLCTSLRLMRGNPSFW